MEENNTITDRVLEKLKTILEADFPGSIYNFKQSEGTEFGKPSQLSLKYQGFGATEIMMHSAPHRIDGKVGNSWCFSGCLGVSLYTISPSKQEKFRLQVIDSAMRNNDEILNFLSELVIRKKQTSPRIKVGRDIPELTAEIKRLKRNLEKDQITRGAYKYYVQLETVNNNLTKKFYFGETYWSILTNLYYILGQDNEENYRARVLTFSYPKHKDDLISTCVIVQVRENLLTGKITYHVGYRSLTNEKYPYITSFPTETLCKNVDEVLEEVSRLDTQDIVRINSILN